MSAPEYNKPWQTRQNPMVFKLDGDMTHGFADRPVTGGTAVRARTSPSTRPRCTTTDPDNNKVVVETVPEPQANSDKTFTLTLVDPFDTTITRATATGTIVDDD